MMHILNSELCHSPAVVALYPTKFTRELFSKTSLPLHEFRLFESLASDVTMHKKQRKYQNDIMHRTNICGLKFRIFSDRIFWSA